MVKLDKTDTPVTAVTSVTTEVAGKIQYQDYDIEKDRATLVAKLTGEDLQKVDEITNTIDVFNLSSIATYGAEAAEEISKASDIVLNSMDLKQLDDSGRIMKSLSKIMGQFDKKDLEPEKTGFFAQLFGNSKEALEKLTKKYTTLGGEIENIYVQIKEYEEEIVQSNNYLKSMFEANQNHYHQLVLYIVAGEQGCKEIREEIERRQNTQESHEDQFQISELQTALDMLEQRVSDLKMAETIALQSVPMIKMQEKSNFDLVRKMESAFVVTLPTLKQAIAQSMMLKRQRVMAKSMKTLDDTTNEALIASAKQNAALSIETAKLASGSSIKIETVEKTWNDIMNGITEAQRIRDDAHKKRIADDAKLKQLQQNYIKFIDSNNSRPAQ